MVLDRVGVLTDEVSGDFSAALDWAVGKGLGWVEVRTVDGKNAADLDDAELGRVRREVDRRGLRVSALASPLFKCALDPSRPVEKGDLFGSREEPLEAHFARLPRVAAIARALGTDKVRVFSFWREREPRKHLGEVVAHLKRASALAEREGVRLLLENEVTCNGGYADEVANIVRGADSPALRVLWDPGNEQYGGRVAYPEGYVLIRGLFEHVHLKDCARDAEGRPSCVPIGRGETPLEAQLRALERDGYRGLYTIETHYTPPGGTRMQGTEESLEGLKTMLSEAKLA